MLRLCSHVELHSCRDTVTTTCTFLGLELVMSGYYKLESPIDICLCTLKSCLTELVWGTGRCIRAPLIVNRHGIVSSAELSNKGTSMAAWD